jgi:hypothetical protein
MEKLGMEGISGELGKFKNGRFEKNWGFKLQLDFALFDFFGCFRKIF